MIAPTLTLPSPPTTYASFPMFPFNISSRTDIYRPTRSTSRGEMCDCKFDTESYALDGRRFRFLRRTNIRLQLYATFPAKSPADPPHWGTGDGESGKPTDEDDVKVLMLLTVILFIIISSSSPNSFIPWLKRSFSANPSHRSLPFLLQD